MISMFGLAATELRSTARRKSGTGFCVLGPAMRDGASA
jgi:hypothetical protein